MKHIILTRMRFEDRELMKKYINISKKFFIPSLKSQTCKNFTLALICKEEDVDFLKKELDFPFIRIRDNIDFELYSITNNIEIQTRHDCDDWMRKDYIETIQRLYEENKDKYKSFLIHSQPIKYMLHQNKRVSLAPYGPLRTSMHLTICQSKVEHHIHKEVHSRMGKFAEHVIKLEEGFTEWVIHGDNITVNRTREKGKKHI